MQGAGAVWSVPPLSPTQGKQLLSGWVVIEITRKASEFFEAILLERHLNYQAAKDPFLPLIRESHMEALGGGYQSSFRFDYSVVGLGAANRHQGLMHILNGCEGRFASIFLRFLQAVSYC